MIEVSNLIQTCCANPSQWEFRTFEDRPVYVRYRWGGLSVRLGFPGANIDDAIRYGYEIVDYQSENDWDGNLDWREVEFRLQLLNKKGILLALKDMGWEEIRNEKIKDDEDWEMSNRDDINARLLAIERRAERVVNE